MNTNNTIEQGINEIRLAIYEETKNMTLEERVAYTRKMAQPFIQKYAIKYKEK